MAECEICGREDAGYVAQIEGARLTTCAMCAKGGRILERPAAAPRQVVQPVVRRGMKEPDIVSDFGERIVRARKKMGIDRKVLAELIHEKDSFLDRVERGKSMPNETLARKLEKALGIILREDDASDNYAPVPKDKSKGLTLGDIVNVKKKRDEEEE